MLSLFATLAVLATPVVNGGFEGLRSVPPESAVGQGWAVQVESGQIEVRTLHTGAAEGRDAAEIRASSDDAIGGVTQRLAAGELRGKRIRLTLQLRTSGHAKAQGWVRVDRARGQQGFFDNMDNRPVTSNRWTRATLVGDIAPDAEVIALGALAIGGRGRVEVDDVRLEVLGDTPKLEVEAPRPLTPRGLENLRAFADLYGIVWLFHPSDEALAADWERIAVEGVRAVEGAETAQALALALQRSLGSVAPSLVVHVAGETPALPELTAAKRVRLWRHRGFGRDGNNPESIYESKALTLPVSQRPAAAPDPSRWFDFALAGGVVAHLPLAVFVGDRGSLPRRPAQERTSDAEAPTASSWDFSDRATRLGAVIKLWNGVEHVFPYFDVVGTDWNAALSEALSRAATDASEPAFARTVQLMAAALHDGHTLAMYHPDSLGRPPIAVRWVDGKLIVVRVLDERSGAKPGDAVLQVDGKPVETLAAELAPTIGAATPQWRAHRVEKLIFEGPTGSTANLELEAPDGARRTISVARSEKADELPETPPHESYAELKPGIVYVDLRTFDEREWDRHLAQLRRAKGIVFDLRGYPKGDAFVPLAQLATRPLRKPRWLQPVVYLPHRQELTFEGRTERVVPRSPHLSARAVFLTDGSAISYAESLMATVEGAHLGEIVGSTTAGTNGNINFSSFGPATLSYSGLKVLKPDGSRYHGVGVAPTIPCSPTRQGIAAGRDEVLEAGLGALENSSEEH